MYQNHKQLYQFTGIVFLLILIITFGFMFIEKITFFDSLWMTVVSILAVGYGDLVPKHTSGKIFALILIPIAMGFTTYMLTYLAASMIEGRLSKKWERKKRMKRIKKMENHYIICGYEQVGEQVLEELRNHNYDIVIIESHEGNTHRIPEDATYLLGDAKQNEVLEEAGVSRAHGLVATTSNDSTNVFITLSAKGINPDLKVISRAENAESEDKLKRAGADEVVNPSNLGGRRMALSLIKPVSMRYVDSIIHAESNRYQFEEYHVGEISPYVDQRTNEINWREDYGVTLLGIQRDDCFISNPSKEESISEGDILILFGDKEDLQSFLTAS
ncbi:potassium channel protein [Halobacillus locisalis]|uniref:Potassium channel protein n=1 Tax=Halobacillus locisalis TaxID=220753 RepID=A0A838CX32_9BACI|nr:potassium channel protein [Halobacillus locisalis]MBA2176483.1 potassium channel protein [Halobacillus locisalis]